MSAHALPVLIEGTGRRATVVYRIGWRIVPEHVEREGVVAQVGKHIGSPALIIRHAVPIVNDQDEALWIFRLSPVTGEALPIECVGHVFCH